jgi:hypothetical protein
MRYVAVLLFAIGSFNLATFAQSPQPCQPPLLRDEASYDPGLH